MSNLTKKIVAIATGLTLATMLFPVVPVQALTADELQAQINDLLATLAGLQDQLTALTGEEPAATGGAIVGVPEDFTFDKALYYGMSDTDVKYLQIVLNSDEDTQLAESGAGSPGNETKYFGPITKAGAIKFQEKYADEVLASWGLTSGTGYVGQTTRTKLNSLLETAAGEEPAEEPAGFGTAATFTLSGTPVASDYVYITLTDAENVVKCSADVLSAPAGVTLNSLTDSLTTKFGNCANFTASSDGNVITVVTTGASFEIDVDVDKASGSTLSIVGAITEAAGEEEEEEEPVGEGLTITLADDTPVAGTLIGGSDLADLVHFTFANGDSSDVSVTTLKVKRGGVSDDADLTALYLFEGYERLGDESTLSSGYASFNKSSGLFTVPAGGSKTITIRGKVADSSGHTLKLSIESDSDITSDASAISGTFALSGNTMSIVAAPSTAATFKFGDTVSPSAPADIDATTDYIVWSDTVVVTQQDVSIEYIKFSQIGSIPADGLENIRLDMSGTEIATGELVAADVGQELIFDLSDSPVTISKGLTKTLTIYADIVKGSGKTIRMSIEKSADIFVKDASYGNYLLAAKAGGVFAALRTGILSINNGSVTVIKSLDSPSASVVLASNNISLAKYDVKAMGENVKINSLKLEVMTDSTTTKYLRNVSLFLDGVQVGNTKSVASEQHTVTSTDFNIYQTLLAGETKVLEVKGDVYGCAASTCTGSNVLTSGKYITMKVVGGDLDNAQGKTSLTMIDAPAAGASADGTQRTVGTGSMTLVKSPSYGDQNISAGADTKIGEYKIEATEYDSVSISAFTVAVTVDTMTLTDLSNIYLKYDSTETSPKGSVSASNVFSVSKTLAASGNLTVEVWSKISTGASDAEWCSTSLAVTASRVTDGVSANKDAVAGQKITIKTGALAETIASDTPLAESVGVIVGDKADQLLAKFTFAANYEPWTVEEIQITSTSTPGVTSDDYTGVYLKYNDASGNSVTSAAKSFISNVATFTGQSFYVLANNTADVEVYGNMNVVGAGYADNGDRPQLGLTYWKADSPSQPDKTGPTAAVWANQFVLYKTAPTVLLGGAENRTLTLGSNTLYEFSIAADSKGNVGVKKITFNVSPSMSTTSDTIGTFKLYQGSTDITSLVDIYEATTSGTVLSTSGQKLTSVQSATTVLVVFKNERIITGGTSETYSLKANVTGVGAVGSGESIQSYIKDDIGYVAPAAYGVGVGNFIWTDRSELSHLEGTPDWQNGYLVNTLDSTTLTLSR